MESLLELWLIGWLMIDPILSSNLMFLLDYRERDWMRGDIRTLLLPCVMFCMDQLLSSTKGWGTHAQCSGLTGAFTVSTAAVNLRTFFWTHDLCLKKRIKHTASVHPSSGVNVSLMDPWLYKRYLMREQTTKAYIKTTIRVAAWTNVTKNVWGRGATLHNSNSCCLWDLDETIWWSTGNPNHQKHVTWMKQHLQISNTIHGKRSYI